MDGGQSDQEHGPGVFLHDHDQEEGYITLTIDPRSSLLTTY